MKVFVGAIVLALFSLPVAANEMSKILESQSPTERASTLTTLLHQSGKACGEAVRTFLQGYDSDGAAYWNVACTNGQFYNVQVPDDPAANTRILECGIMKAIGVECFKKL